MQVADVGTTFLDSSRGGVEAMPVTASILNSGGVAQLALLKFLLVVAAGISLGITTMWGRRGPAGMALHRIVIDACMVATVALGLAALQNAALFASL